MKWLELKLDTSPAGLDPVSQLLEEQGITGLVIDDEGDFRDFLEHNHQYWDYVDEELMQEKQGLCRIPSTSQTTRRVITGWRRCGWPCRS